MTAEIAIVNRSAITLAADSAMTVSVGGRQKIYLTDKIFELSERDPIGLMVYNNLEFMGAPIEVVIKQFRRECPVFGALREAPKAFFDYLVQRWMPTEETQRRHAHAILAIKYRKVFLAFERRQRDNLRAAPQDAREQPLNILLACVADAVSDLEDIPIAECFREVDEAAIQAFYEAEIDRIIEAVFYGPPLEDEHLQLCRRLGTLTLHREVFSEIMSGLVFAGFGSSELFPSLQSFHTDGIVFGRLKTKQTEGITTSSEQISAKVIPFAQREVVDRFLSGIDPLLEVGIKTYMDTVLAETQRCLFQGVPRLSSKSKSNIMSNIEATAGDLFREFPAQLERIKLAYAKETEDMVLFMAKQDSAHLAESLVNITSLKRRYSPDAESVGGPIDVAVISRNDGFVWVKRKHYFPPELNQRYIARKFGVTWKSEERRYDTE